MKSKWLVAVMATVIVLLVVPQALAQSGSSGWDFAIAPYLWAAGMDGKLSIGQLEQDVDVSFGDIIDNLDFALMGHFDMRNERWLVSSDLVFVDLEHEEAVANGTLTAGMDLTLLEVAGGYRVSPAVALLVGARWVDMTASFRYSGELIEPAVDGGTDWIDPLVGVNVVSPLAERWWVGLSGDVGGFGIGSELSWQASGNIGFRASHLVSIILGYHALDIDYESDRGPRDAGADILISGPQLGVAFTF